jgi:hypothetical protein
MLERLFLPTLAMSIRPSPSKSAATTSAALPNDTIGAPNVPSP